MTTSNTSTSSAFSLPAGAPSAARATLKLLLRLKHGTLTVKLPDGSVQRFGNGQAPQASLHLLNWNVCSAALKSGDIGFAESYIAGDWTTPHLTDLLQVFIVNRKEVEDVIYDEDLQQVGQMRRGPVAGNVAFSKANVTRLECCAAHIPVQQMQTGLRPLAIAKTLN